MGAIDPTREQFEAFKQLPRDEPVHMLNLIRCNEQAQYPAGHPQAAAGRTGRQAYAEYGRTSGAVFRRVGGRIVWSGRPEAVVIGGEGEQWDIAFVAEYPTAAAFLEMVTDPDYREHVVHRQAAVADSRLIRMRPLPSGPGFGEQALTSEE